MAPSSSHRVQFFATPPGVFVVLKASNGAILRRRLIQRRWRYHIRNHTIRGTMLLKRPGTMQLLNFQEDRNGMAKAYQVRQLIRAIDRLAEG